MKTILYYATDAVQINYHKRPDYFEYERVGRSGNFTLFRIKSQILSLKELTNKLDHWNEQGFPGVYMTRKQAEQWIIDNDAVMDETSDPVNSIEIPCDLSRFNTEEAEHKDFNSDERFKRMALIIKQELDLIRQEAGLSPRSFAQIMADAEANGI